MNSKFSSSGTLRRLAVLVAACGTIAAPAAFANPVGDLVLVPPAELPDSARQPGEAMFLRDVGAGTLLYIEQDRGARITVLDVTDPSRIRNEGSVQLDAPAAFDFVAPVGHRSELVRFRQGGREAVLDLHKPTVPSLKTVQGLFLTGPVTQLGADGFAVASGVAAPADATRNYQVVDTAGLASFGKVFDVNQVNQELTKPDTGTTFLMTDGGLYLIRQPAVEDWKHLQDFEKYSN
jgi:hypothetical protein